MNYNKGTFGTAFKAMCAVTLLSFICVFAALSHSETPRLVSAHPWFYAIGVVPPGTAGAGTTKRIVGQGKLDERFAVSWPTSLRVGAPDRVIVRIAANDYEALLDKINGQDRKVETETFKGEPRLEVTLTPDSGLEVVKQHSDVQVVVKGKRHREWSWSIWPKATGPHQLTLLVQGMGDKDREDYDPEVMQYDVAFNFGYWVWNAIQQNAANWVWTVFVAGITGLGGWLLGRRSKRS